MYECTIGIFLILEGNTFIFGYYGRTDIMWSTEGTDIRTIE
jgi:hypothetical protein